MKKIIKAIFLGSLLLGSGLYAQGFGIGVGPFSLQFNTSDGYYVYEYKEVLDSPICYAISHQKRLEMIVDGSEKVSDNEIRLVTKRVVVEPYAFGITSAGKPVLMGKVVEEKKIRETTIKYDEEGYREETITLEQKKKGFFSGLFRSGSQNLDVRKVSQIRVIEDSSFDIPRGFKGFTDSDVRVVCQLPID